MCGITGFVDRTDKIQRINILNRMVDTLTHRGPDDDGYWFDDVNGVALGHRRLAVQDLSSAGRQPMVSNSGRYTIVYNGEIYNHLELRKELPVSSWKGHSDTETLLAGFELWGIKKTLEKCNGMFAFALWDKSQLKLTLSRDRIGEKPLYYGWQNNAFVFGSELKAIKQCHGFEKKIDRGALSLLLRHNYIPATHTIYKDIYKLQPGTFITISFANGIVKAKDAQAETYWSFNDVVNNGVLKPFTGDDSTAITTLESMLMTSVEQQMLSDVPLGAFLSGGIDSSLIVALMQKQSSKPINTFTIGFEEKEYNEAVFAKAVAKHLGTAHHELYVTHQQVNDVIPNLATLYDEPFADASQIPTFLVSQLASKNVTVSLSGDGGDELFGGYNRYFWSSKIWNKISWMPFSARIALSQCLTIINPEYWNVLFSLINKALPSKLHYANPGDKIHKLADKLKRVSSVNDLYYSLVSEWSQPRDVVIDGVEPLTHITNKLGKPNFDNVPSEMMYLDTLTYLPDDILVKVDRAAMSNSLETRVPFLDHRVIDFAWQLPLNMKIRNGNGKWILRELLSKHIPRELIERPKMGFGIPIDSLLRGPLYEWAEALLNKSKLEQGGYFRADVVRKIWDEHQTGNRNWQYKLWSILMFQAWLEAE